MKCPVCGSFVDSGISCCPSCRARLSTPEPAAEEREALSHLPIGDIGPRFVAMLIDGIMVSLITGMIMLMIVDLIPQTGFLNMPLKDLLRDLELPATLGRITVDKSILWLLVMLVYYGILEGSSTQATIGKLWMSLRVSDTQGREIGFARAFGRAAMRWISVICVLGFLVALISPKRQAFHDFWPGTLVLWKRAPIPRRA